jgi:hypothetical protein
VQRAVDRAGYPEAFRLREIRMATAEEVQRLNEIVARLQTRLGVRELRRQCLYRTLRVNEYFDEYFSDKRRLQSYVFPASTPSYKLIEDMIEGIPLSMQPLIKANVSRLTTLEEFRRTLIDLEPGLRGRKVSPYNPGPARNISVSKYDRAEKRDGTTTVSQTRVVKPVYNPPSAGQSHAGTGTLPRTNCYNCGGNHCVEIVPIPRRLEGTQGMLSALERIQVTL